ncbi:hypothetical protein PoB_000566000 [Plakobranchus ocellatus]|uniref:Salivary lipocalin n=1 Tax=Plakobranchus ocellatus TaxID=259542 RepID=A0AAV3Y8N2_9GAST|nr:hypothetical protein PoB_000566000 [Plakobranchus ocellatus]
MYLRTVLLLLGVLAIASAQGKRKPVILRISRPLEEDRSTNPLMLVCSFVNLMTKMRTINSLTILRSDTGEEANYTSIATVTPKSKTSNLGEPELTVFGEINERGESIVLAEYAEPNTGYCFFYKCVVEGTDKSGSFRTYNRKTRDRCDNKKRYSSDDVSEQSKNIMEKIKMIFGQIWLSQKMSRSPSASLTQSVERDVIYRVATKTEFTL